ncbi:MAG TPA: thiol reductant ABC exporter subunit CydD, partial [Pseudonocardiaceae bacterium]
MKPVDPRLLRNAAAARIFILAAAALGVLAAVLIIAQADLLARVITNAFLGHAAISAAVTPLALLTLVVVGRAVVAWLSESAAHRASTSVIAQLRAKVVDHVLRVGPRDVDRSPAEVANLATRGLDGLDGYFARYMPQLLLATVVPLAVGARILFADWVSAIIVACTIPLIPIFMILIGLYTRRDVSRQWRTLSVLANHFVDLIAGLSVLTAFGRAREQRRTIREVTEKYRGQTMRTLRVAFLSSMVLDLLATLSVACIAVAIGLRLVYGYMDLQTGLVVLILAPEVYLPLRAVGTRFHDSAEGVAAADEVFKLLESTAEVPGGHVPAPDPSKAPVTLSDIRVDGRSGPILDGLSMDIAPGEVVGVVGPSGAGKTTLLDLLLTWRRPDAGEITIGGAPLSELDRAAWLARIAWVPQQPRLVAGRVIDNLRLGAPNATDEQVRAAAEAAALDVPLDRPVGELGAGLSTGQQRRVALARALLADRPLLLLDEPTEGVDAATERAIVNALPGMLAGRSAVIVTHHPALLRLCDRVVTIAGRAPEPVPTTAPEETENLMSATPRTVVFSEDADGADQFGTDQMGTDDLVPGGADKDGGTSPWHWLADAVRPYRKRVVVATAWGSAALAGGVAMISCSAWLITKSALEPPILSLMIAIGAVQFFGIGKSMVRYMERLASHDAALRVLADLRVRIWEALAKLGPTLTSRLRRGDLLSRLMADVDAQQDVLVRGLVPGLSAGVVGILTSIVMALLNAPSGATLLVALIVAGVAAPLLTVATGKLAERRTAASKAAVLAGTMELLQAAPDLLAFGAADARRSTLRRSDAELTSALGRSAWARGAGDGLGTLAIGLATVACTWFGVLALHAGQ